jgi:FkbM family methyltransferase
LLGSTSGNLAYDIGARNGDSSVFLLEHGWERVMAFEPNPQSFRLLEATALLYPRAIEPVNVGLGAEVGEAEFTSVLDGRMISQGHMTTIDIEAAKTGAPELIKIDMDGQEKLVLSGGNKTLESVHPILYIEYEKGNRESLMEILYSLGYGVLNIPQGNTGHGWLFARWTGIPLLTSLRHESRYTISRFLHLKGRVNKTSTQTRRG